MGSTEPPSPLKSTLQGNGIGVDDAAAAGKAESDAGYLDIHSGGDGFLNIVAGSLAFDVVGEGENNFLDSIVLKAASEAAEIDIFRTDAIDGNQFSMQDMIGTRECPGMFDRYEVRDLLDHTDDSLIPFRILAYLAHFVLAEVCAYRAPLNAPFRRLERLHKFRKIVGPLHGEVQGNALRRPVADSRKSFEDVLQVFKGRGHKGM